MRESTLEKQLVSEVKKIGGLAPKWTSPGNRGVPDRLIIFPDGVIIFVEMKAPGKPLAPLQEKWKKELLKRGHQHYTIDSVESIVRFIEEVRPK